MKKTNKFILGAGALVAAVAPVAAVVACGTTEQSLKYVAYNGGAITANDVYFVTDGGQIDDKTFNESVWKGTKTAASFSDKTHAAQPRNASEIGSKYNDVITKGAKLIVASGFNHASALNEITAAKPGVGFVWIDGTLSATDEKSVKKQQGNVSSVVFDTFQPSFLEGVLAAKAAAQASHHAVGVYGGMDIPSVNDYINGFIAGVKYFNDHKQTGAPEVAIENGGYAGNFNVGGKSQDIAKSLVAKTDLILPVGGPQYQDVLKEITGTVKVIGVDTDINALYSSVPATQGKIFGSILKKLEQVTSDVVAAIMRDPADTAKGFGHVFKGDLDNGFVGITQNNPSVAGLTGVSSWADVIAAAKAAEAAK